MFIRVTAQVIAIVNNPIILLTSVCMAFVSSIIRSALDRFHDIVDLMRCYDVLYLKRGMTPTVLSSTVFTLTASQSSMCPDRGWWKKHFRITAASQSSLVH